MRASEAAIAVAAEACGVRPVDVRGPRRYGELVRARKMAAREMRAAGMTYPAIGRALGGRHHTTAMNLCGVFEPATKEAA